jgi:hypothetical protein
MKMYVEDVAGLEVKEIEQEEFLSYNGNDIVSLANRNDYKNSMICKQFVDDDEECIF